MGVDDQAQDKAQESKVMEFLWNHPLSSGNAVAEGCHIKRIQATKILKSLHEQRKANYEDGPRNSQLWSLLPP